MKFSFDFENYRKNLADELKEKRKESKKDTRNILEDEQKTEKYKTSKDLKDISNEIKKAESLTETEVEIIDIADKIPENLRLFMDRRRIWEITDGNLTPEGFPKLSDAEIEELKVFVNEITENNFFDKKKINTVIQAYGGTLEGLALTCNFPISIPKNKGEKINKLKKEENNNSENYRIKIPDNRKQLDPYSFMYGNNAYFAAGDNHWFDTPAKVIVICDPFSKRFKKEASFVGVPGRSKEYRSTFLYDKNRDKQEVDKIYKKAIEYASKYTESGISIRFKDDVKWVDIAEWIVDLPNGKLYKISGSKNKTEAEE